MHNITFGKTVLRYSDAGFLFFPQSHSYALCTSKQ